MKKQQSQKGKSAKRQADENRVRPKNIDWELRFFALASRLLIEEIRIADLKSYPEDRIPEYWDRLMRAAINDSLMTAKEFITHYRHTLKTMEGSSDG